MTRKKSIFNKLFDLMRLRSHSDGLITFIILVFMLFGSLMIVSTNVGQTVYNANVVLNTTLRQIVIMAIGYGCYIFAARHFHFRKFAFWRTPLVVGMCVAMFSTFFFAESGGSHAWIRLPGGFTIQPAEFLKPFMIAIVASAMHVAKKKKTPLLKGGVFRYPYICIAIFTVFLLAQKDIGTLAILLMTYFTMILIPTEKSLTRQQSTIVFLGIFGVVMAVGLFGVTDIGTQIIAKSPFSHIATRIYNAKDPYQNVYGEGYQPANSLFGIGSSNIVGKGIGDSTRKYGYLTQADNDYILAVIVEETGVFGLGLIVLLNIVLISRLFYYAFKTNEVIFKIILTGTATYFFMHFFLNVGGVACLIPFTGVPLLFVSSGGSSLFAACFSLGMCQTAIRRIRESELGI